MKDQYDVIVVGLGAVGSGAAFHLAQRGVRVCGFDRFAPPHTLGSTHGGSRIIRKAYFEGDQYGALLGRSYELWHALEEQTRQTLLHVTGGLNIGLPESEVVAGARQSCEVNNLPYEMLSADEVTARFPAYQVAPEQVALWDAQAGWLSPEVCVASQLAQARQHGAHLRFDEPVLDWAVGDDSVRVTSPSGIFEAGALILSTGGWLSDLLPGLMLTLTVERAVNGWFQPRVHAGHFDPERCPIYIWESMEGAVLYGFPDTGEGVKAGIHHAGTLVNHPDALQRDVTTRDEEQLSYHLRQLFPDLEEHPFRAATCFYTNTPDQHYVIDRHPEYAQVAFASACSGHGFKASIAVGEAVANLATGQQPHIDLSPFRLRW